ncbi:MAG: CocE/NonD family hydrolase [Dehalococcoidia bacterium]
MATVSDVRVQRNIRIPMRDGVRLAADLYLPAGYGPFPVLMERTPYNKSAPQRQEQGTWFAQRGYAVLFQDVRGRFASEGKFTKYVDDGRDGIDTLLWLLRQQWCNGAVGTFGISYGAHTQAALASEDGPKEGLGALFLDAGGFSNAFMHGVRHQGAFELRQAVWAYTHALQSPEAQRNSLVKGALEAEDLRAWFTRMPWKPGHSPLCWAPDYETYLLELWTHSRFDTYWKQVGLYAEGYYHRWPDVPILLLGSWYDPYARTSCDTFVGLRKAGRRKVRLVMGAWTHGQHQHGYAGDVDFGPEASLPGNLAESYNHFRLRWFDYALRGLPTGMAEPPVLLFVMGGGSGRKTPSGRLEHGGKWRAENEWPLARTRWTPFYLHGGGLLSPEPPHSTTGRTSYTFDPRHPVPTIGGSISSGSPIMEPGAYDQREGPRFFGCQPPYLPLASRPDVLVFQTHPLERDVEVTGPITAHLYVSSTAPDTDFTVKLIDVYPPNADYPQGFALNLTDTIFRARFHISWEREEMLQPGRIYHLTIELFPTSNLFKAGHRIRVDISSSNFPRFDVNPNTGEPLGRSSAWQVAVNTVHHNAICPSHILLPIIPTE